MVEQENWQTFQKRIQVFSEPDKWLLDYAYQLAKAGHRTQLREEGIRYFEHARSVFMIVFDEIKLYDANLGIAALLHDVGEDTSIFGNKTKKPYSQWKDEARYLITRAFNEEVSDLVLGVTRPAVDGFEIKTKFEADQKALQILEESNSKTKILKMCDRLHNLRTMKTINLTKGLRKFNETVDHYFPIFETAKVDYPEETKYLMREMKLTMNSYGFNFVDKV